jgi:hypothetical protein
VASQAGQPGKPPAQAELRPASPYLNRFLGGGVAGGATRQARLRRSFALPEPISGGGVTGEATPETIGSSGASSYLSHRSQRDGRGQARIRDTERIDQLDCFLPDFQAKLVYLSADGSRFQAGKSTVFQIPSLIGFYLG